MEAHGLTKVDKFGLSDPYVVVRANGGKEVSRVQSTRVFHVPRGSRA